VVIWTDSFVHSETAADLQPSSLWRGLGMLCVVVTALVALARPWLPASSAAWVGTGAVGASFLFASGGPWLLLLPIMAAAVLLRWDDMVGVRTGPLVFAAALAILAITSTMGAVGVFLVVLMPCILLGSLGQLAHGTSRAELADRAAPTTANQPKLRR
jgi:hypothetical protein